MNKPWFRLYQWRGNPVSPENNLLATSCLTFGEYLSAFFRKKDALCSVRHGYSLVHTSSSVCSNPQKQRFYVVLFFCMPGRVDGYRHAVITCKQRRAQIYCFAIAAGIAVSPFPEEKFLEMHPHSWLALLQNWHTLVFAHPTLLRQNLSILKPPFLHSLTQLVHFVSTGFSGCICSCLCSLPRPLPSGKGTIATIITESNNGHRKRRNSDKHFFWTGWCQRERRLGIGRRSWGAGCHHVGRR